MAIVGEGGVPQAGEISLAHNGVLFLDELPEFKQQLRKICQINEAGTQLLKTAMGRLKLSARAYDRILKVALTIADMDSSENIETNHLADLN